MPTRTKKTDEPTKPILEPAAIEQATRTSVFEAFAAAAQAWPERPAIIDEAGVMNYRELAAAAARVHALLLTRRGTGTGVGVWCEQPRQQIAAMLGVLRAGDYYVMLDPDYPTQRRHDILADGAVSVLLADETTAAPAEKLAGGKLAVLRASARATIAPPPAEVAPHHLAYVSYTSGSTGRPKGVMHSHGNILHESAVHRATLQLGPADRGSLLYSTSVVGAVRDVFGPLLAGGAVCPFPFKRRGFAALKDWLRARGVTQLHAVPVLFRELVAAMGPEEQLPAVRTVFLAGDRVLPEDVRRFRRHFAAGARFYTGIGASEANSIYTHWFVDATATEESDKLPSGWPLPHKEVWILDERGTPVPHGEAGEIVVCSEYLALGYWRRPELNAATFAAESDGSRRRIYCTGDIGRFDAEGRLVHLGRRDQQVKINGERIELDEVERALLAAPGVQAAAARAFADGQDGARSRLVGYVVARAGGFDERAVRAELARRLSPSARPGRLVLLEALPLTPNGKVDRSALPPPAAFSATPAAELERSVSPSAHEARVRAVWREVLPHADPQSSAETFEQLGGDSLQAVRLALLLRQRCGVEWPPGLTLREASIARLAAHVATTLARGTATEPALDRFHFLAESWALHTCGRRVAADVPVFVAGENKPGRALVWLGIQQRGLQIGLALARWRPVYLVPALAHSAETSAEAIDAAYACLAEKLAPRLPDDAMIGGLCASGLQAMMLGRALARWGKTPPKIVAIDAFGERWLWDVFDRLRLYENFSKVDFRWRRGREIGWPALAREELRSLARRRHRENATATARAREREDATPEAGPAFVGRPEPLLAVVPPRTSAEMMLGLSRGCGWLRWLARDLGWRTRGVDCFALPVAHTQLWAPAEVARVAGVLERILRSREARRPASHSRVW